MRIRTERFKTLVILDEIHHAGDALSWGEGVREAFEPGHPPAGADRHAVPLRHQPDPVRHLRARAPTASRASLRRLHLRLRRRAGRPRRASGAVPGLLRGDAVAHPRRRRGRRPAGRAADQGPARAGAAHRARPAGILDAGGAGGRRPAALRGAPARARRRRAGDRDRPGLRARLRRAAQEDQRARQPTVVLSDEKGASQQDRRRFTERRRALDGRGPDGLRGRRRAAAGGRRLRDHHLDAAVLRPGGRPLRARPARAARPRRSSCRRCRRCSASPPTWRSSATTCSAAGSPTRTTCSPPRRTCSPVPRPGSGDPDELRPMPFEALGSQATFDHVLYDGGAVRPRRARCMSGPRRRWTSSASRGCSSPTRCASCCSHRQRARRQDDLVAREADALDRGHHPRAARRAAPRAQRAGRRLAPPHRPGARRHARGAAQGVRRPAGRGGQRRPAARTRIDRLREWATRKSS